MFDKSKPNTDSSLGKTNRIVEGTTIKGEINSTADFRLDGKLIGNFTSNAKLVIGPKAEVLGDIIASNLDIEGRFEGRLKISGLLALKESASVKGEMVVGKLSVEPGANVTATCTMQGSSKATTNPDAVPTKQDAK